MACGAVSIVTIVASVLSGERTNFILRVMAGMLASLVFRPIWARYFLLVVVQIVAISGVFCGNQISVTDLLPIF